MFEVKVKAVESGAFPMDMLRYDRLIPATEEDALKISMSFGLSGWGRAVYPEFIVLRGAQEPTPERWESKGWVVVEVKNV